MKSNKIFNRERMEKALDSEVHIVPEGLSREEIRDFIIDKADNPLDELSNIDQELGLYWIVLATTDEDIKLIPDDVWERVENIREKARIARGEE